MTETFAARVHDELGFDTFAPYSGTEYDLGAGEFIRITEGIPVDEHAGGAEKHEESEEKAKKKASASAEAVFARLLAAGERLLGVIRRNEGGSNKDLAKFAGQINSLCDKWDR